MLIMMDDYSRYPEVEIVPTTSAAVVIPKVEKMMATHGLFSEVRTDNGPPFNSPGEKATLWAVGSRVAWRTLVFQRNPCTRADIHRETMRWQDRQRRQRPDHQPLRRVRALRVEVLPRAVTLFHCLDVQGLGGII
ncbi:hypothetical protein NDU88_002326 [Pleurodeles waltl]|uniref:Integrase catalytic domain-containing protein n=1 Tax=Pleurodeles waltl TaxID=8319 RepID=A0AAV7KRU0_PLEWA|nr:hypothetical protein NDU88_002326 [Pleurodeles waltl]